MGSIRKKTFTLFKQNTEITPKEVCSKLHLSYHENRRTISTYLSQFRCQYKNSLSAYSRLNLPHWRRWVWNKVKMTDNGLKLALSHGWKKCSNRNKQLLFKCDLGSVQWYPKGSAFVFTKGRSNEGKAKTLFCKAFSWMSNIELNNLCMGSPREVGKHWEIDVSKSVPRGINIAQFQKTHGLRFHTDNSHDSNIIEIEETVPLYLQEINKTLNLFDENIKSHLKLVTSSIKLNETLIKESDKRAAANSLDLSKNQANSGEGFWKKFLRIMVTPL